MSKRVYIKCTQCHEYHWNDIGCDPTFMVYHEDYMGDEAKEVRGADFSDAALAYAKWYNTHDAEFSLINNEITIQVEQEGVVKEFTVGAEPDIYYSAKEV